MAPLDCRVSPDHSDDQLPSYLASDDTTEGWFAAFRYRDSRTIVARLNRLPCRARGCRAHRQGLALHRHRWQTPAVGVEDPVSEVRADRVRYIASLLRPSRPLGACVIPPCWLDPALEVLTGEASVVKSVAKAIESYLGRFLLWVTCVLLAALIYSMKTATPGAWDAGDWEAVAAVLTALVAFVAISVAVVQLQDARDVRWEQALPYVAGYLDPDSTDPRLVYVAVKNFGTTVATGITLEITPPPTRSNRVGGGELRYPRALPALVPGQEWRTFWDFSVSRFQDKLENDHVLRITFTDSRGDRHQVESALGWEPYIDGRRWIGRKSIHHIGESMKKVEKSVAAIAENTTPNSTADGNTGSPSPPSLLQGDALEALGFAYESDKDTDATGEPQEAGGGPSSDVSKTE